jgi:hypothetical protein
MNTFRYRIKDWDTRFESFKSKTYKCKTQSYIPNKVGLGYVRIMREHDGAAIYGAWCATVALLSRMEAPRHGYLTDNGRSNGSAHDSKSLGMLTMIHQDIIQRMMILCSSKDIGWLEVMDDRGSDRVTDSLPFGDCQGDCHGHSPLPLPSPLPVPMPIQTGKISDQGDKYERIRSIPQTKLAEWAAKYCEDAPEWIRVYNSYIGKLGPEGFRGILEQFVAEVDSGEDGRKRGAVLVAKLKEAMQCKR